MADAAQWAVGKALAPVADGVLGAWAGAAGISVQPLKTQLEQVQATLETAATKELVGPATDTEDLLRRLRDSAHNADDLLDELDYLRIHDELHGNGGVHDLARHTSKAAGKLPCLPNCWSAPCHGDPGQVQDARQHVSCCAWPPAQSQSLGANSSSVPNANQDGQVVSGCMPKLGNKLLPPCSSSPLPHVTSDEDHGNAQGTPELEFNRNDFSQRMNDIVQKLQLMCNELNNILQCCGPRTVPNITHGHTITKGRIDDKKMYGRSYDMESIIHDITEGQYRDKGLTVLPFVGPGGLGKTTLIKHVFHSLKVQNHFAVMIWICVSLNFNPDKVLEEIKKSTPPIEGEEECTTTEALIEQRLKSKRLLLVLDDIWQISNEGDWGRLLSTLNKSQEKGCMILVTTRNPAVAQMVKTTDHPIELNKLDCHYFRCLFLEFVFKDELYSMDDHHHLLDTGYKIMEKLNGSPLAAKIVGRLLSKELSLDHWKRVLESKEWENQTNTDDIMPALKLSYNFLPFYLQQCFSYSALFPEDYRFRSSELIALWIGLDILMPRGQNQTFEEIGLSNLNELVFHGFFEEVISDGDRWYVMHDLLHDLALKVASHDCLSLHLPNVGSVEIQLSIRHLSISIEGLNRCDAVFGDKLKSELEELKTMLKVKHLQTLMLFGEVDESFAKIFADFFWEANNLRVLHLPNMLCPVESMLHKISGLFHLRYLHLGTDESEMHLSLNISKFYHLRILDLESWDGSHDLPKDMSNLAKLCHFYTRYDELDIYNVGKLKLLSELKVFRVNKEIEGFEPKQLEQLTKLRELGIYNLEKIHTKEEATQANLIEKNFLKKLTLDWDSERSIVKPDVEALVLESLQPHGDLQDLCIRGHRGPSCPTWLGGDLAVEHLQSLCLVGVSWTVLPPVGRMRNLCKLVLKHIATVKEFVIEQSYCKLIWFEMVGLEIFKKLALSLDAEHMFSPLQVLIIRDCPKLSEFPFLNHNVHRPDQDRDWFPRLKELQIQHCPELMFVPPIPWTETLFYVSIRGVMLLEKLVYSNSFKFHGATLDIVGNDYLHSLDQVLAFSKLTRLKKLSLVKCPPLELKQLVMLTSLKTLIAKNSDALVEQLGGQGDIECLPTPPIGALYTYEGGIIGIEHARDELMQILCKGGNQLKILSVVGFGGLGKTTLAKAVYDKLKMQFDCGAFIRVSQNPDMQKVFMHILYDLHKQNYSYDSTKDEEQLSHEIKKFLQTKRYLIVIDDLWDEKFWNIISLSLPSNDCGSRVITTTRVNKIAEKCCLKHNDSIYEMMPLGYQNSKELFLLKCSASEDSCRDELTEVDEILKFCGGMPLAIIRVASAISPFSAGKIKEHYKEMMKSIHSAPGDLHCFEELTKILSYSYSDLPKTLRDCLLYLASSARNQRIQRDNLVRKWIAEGLIPEDNDCTREEVARRYFDELINRNVIQPVKYAHRLGKETYEVTYIMLYVLRLLSRKENFATFLFGSEPHVEVTPTRLFIQSSDSELPVSTDRVNLTDALSVTMLGPANSVSFKDLKNVQLLDLDGCKDLDNSAMVAICLLIKLKYLSLKQTQVTTLPPQIGKLQNLETLDVSRTQISSLPREISGLQNMETLDVSRTQISNLPAEISKLQNLETLDVRHTLVKELPEEVLQLRKIKHLHFGQSGCFGVKLPVGIDQMKSVQVMGTVDSRECSESAVKDISLLIPKQVKELKVVLYDGPNDMDRNDGTKSTNDRDRNDGPNDMDRNDGPNVMDRNEGPNDKKWNDKLLSSVGKCSKLKSLTIYGDSNPSDELSPESPPGSPYFPELEKLKVAGRFVKVPGWIGQLRTLALLVIRVWKLEGEDLQTIGDLPCLSVLELALVALPRKQVTITSNAGFARLEVFCFDCRVPWISFEEKAMPNLKHLQLKLYSGPKGKHPSGIMLLECLNMVTLLYSSQYEGSVGVKKTVAVMSEDAASHANLIELFINGDRKIFPPNKSAQREVAGTELNTSVNTGAEIEEVPASE